APPSNWQSVFGGPAWSWDARRKQYYMHNFLREQPQLNVGLGAVQDALLDVARFWLERGVDGFRLDAINFAIHNPELTDNPPSGAPMETVTRPFDMQRHVHNQSQPAIPAFLERIRAVMDEYGAVFSVAEVGGPAPLDEMKAFTAGTRRLHSAYSFDFLYADTLTPEGVRAALSNWSDAPGEGWPSWAFSNHDAPRAVSRWAGGHGTEQVSKLLLLLLLSLRGNPFVYQGEELGLPQSAVAFEHLKDPEALANWPHTLGRDGARTPFPWATQAASAGFSSSAETWLPMDTGHAAHAVDRQAQHPSSCLNVTRALLAIRNAAPALRCGTLEFLKTPETVLAYIRQVEGEQVLCAFNLGDEAASWEPASPWAQSGELIASQDGPAAGPLPRSLPARAGYWAKLGPGE
ncbi:MAG: alpha-amylase family glycosyl hydrolase, partial [Pseudomonadota bacterium]